MPRVSEEHLTARREQIIRAATETFGANGFHATTMADVIAVSGLSAGAVYRYFRSKDDLVREISSRAMGAGGAALAELLEREAAPTPLEVLRHLVLATERFATEGTPLDLRRIALQAWAEALRDEQLMVTVKGAQVRLREYFAEAARRSRNAGTLPPDADPSLVAAVLHSLLLGYVVQLLLIGDVDAESYLRGVASLVTAPQAG